MKATPGWKNKPAAIKDGLTTDNTTSKIIEDSGINLTENNPFNYILSASNVSNNLSSVYWNIPLKAYLNYGLPTCEIADKNVRLFSIIPSSYNNGTSTTYNIYTFVNWNTSGTLSATTNSLDEAYDYISEHFSEIPSRELNVAYRNIHYLDGYDNTKFSDERRISVINKKYVFLF